MYVLPRWSHPAILYLRPVQLPSRLIEAAVDQMATLPGIGRRTALRLVLHMLARDEDRVRDFAEAMVAMRSSFADFPPGGASLLT